MYVFSTERRTRKAPSPARGSLGIKDQGSWMRCTRISLSYIPANQPPTIYFSTPYLLALLFLAYPFLPPRIISKFRKMACPLACLPNIKHHRSSLIYIYLVRAFLSTNRKTLSSTSYRIICHYTTQTLPNDRRRYADIGINAFRNNTRILFPYIRLLAKNIH